MSSLNLYDKYQTQTQPFKRRELLIAQMNQNSDKQINCSKCIGNCCTFTSNSMQITPIEALELITYLKTEKGLSNNQIKLQMEQTVAEFRLDQTNYTYGNKLIRKTYTCPFYQNCQEGCSIAPEYKPYGCLAFNPITPLVKEGTNCRSDIKLLEERENQNKEEENFLNENIRKELNIHFEKLSIPMAILKIIRAEENIRP